MQTSNITFLLEDIEIMLSSLWIKYQKISLGTSYPAIFELVDLGVIISGIEPREYSNMLNKLVSKYKNYRLIFITTDDIMFTKKDEVIWDLMRSGYIRYIRYKFQRQFNNLIQQGFGRKIIMERLKLWENNPKYKYLIEENKRCLDIATAHILTNDPAFFDYMPEIPRGDINVQ